MNQTLWKGWDRQAPATFNRSTLILLLVSVLAALNACASDGSEASDETSMAGAKGWPDQAFGEFIFTIGPFQERWIVSHTGIRTVAEAAPRANLTGSPPITCTGPLPQARRPSLSADWSRECDDRGQSNSTGRISFDAEACEWIYDEDAYMNNDPVPTRFTAVPGRTSCGT